LSIFNTEQVNGNHRRIPMLFIATHADIKINAMKYISETVLFKNLGVYSGIGTHILPIVFFNSFT
jgi:hypothetical protein